LHCHTNEHADVRLNARNAQPEALHVSLVLIFGEKSRSTLSGLPRRIIGGRPEIRGLSKTFSSSELELQELFCRFLSKAPQRLSQNFSVVHVVLFAQHVKPFLVLPIGAKVDANRSSAFHG
jgi:hypothetical protein